MGYISMKTRRRMVPRRLFQKLWVQEQGREPSTPPSHFLVTILAGRGSR
jgi:hypothetical protein